MDGNSYIPEAHIVDMSAVHREEEARFNQRQAAADAANSATLRGSMLCFGAGIGAAALGTGLGLLLLCWGLSLLIGRPSIDDVAKAMQAQLADIKRLDDERVALLKNAFDERDAIRGRILADATAKARQAQAEAEQATIVAAQAKQQASAALEKFASKSPGKTVVNFTVFHVSPDQAHNLVDVYTGWNYHSVSDTAPHKQYCHARKGANMELILGIDGTRKPVQPVELSKSTLSADEAAAAFSRCIWFAGSNPNIRPMQ